ncbi:MAG TPA: acetyl-CoA carboxylase biotin carboxyl carrier protein [Lachnospiraceae bacterium]|nr:acetyl-CoA carboxylase biotin carboxyl carrier protein [Lachnospiraceae bacterium]
MNLEMKEIQELLSQFQASDMCELEFEAGEIKLAVRKKEAFFEPEPAYCAAPVPVPAAGTPSVSQVPAAGSASAAAQTPETTAQPEASAAAAGTELTAPLAGIFYRASKPGEAPYVEVGASVKKGETVGLIEAMKIINEVPAPCDGVVTEILAEDSTFAQYGEVLMRIEEKGNV